MKRWKGLEKLLFNLNFSYKKSLELDPNYKNAKA